jgi:alcohol dehydrogenase class IV
VLSERERSFAWRDGDRLIRFGARALADAPALLSEHGFDGYVLLTTRRALDSVPGAGPLSDEAAEVLEVPPRPVAEAAAHVRARVAGRPPVALGGGRVIDSAKAIAAADGLRCAAVPTTLSGAEVTRIHRLPAGVERPRDSLVRPALAIADPEVMASQPRPALTASAMNALAHGAEALYGPRANPVSELAGLRGTELIAAGVEADEAPDREALALGAVLCAWAIDSAGLGLHHALSQTVVRVLRTPHAETNAVMLPHVLRYVARYVPVELGRLAGALGAPQAPSELAASRAAELAAGAGTTRLSELGVEPGEVERVVEAVLARPELNATPGRPGREEVREILLAAM